MIRVAQRVGLPLEAVATAFAALPENKTPTKAEWARMSALWRGELDQRIAQLMLLRDQLTDCIGCGCLSMQRCRLANPGDVLGDQGEGPQRWG
ncbi:Redox-sensitive transcriptional activator SoxR [compost metagenome]